MVACNDHKRLKNNLLVLALANLRNDIFQARCSLYSTYIVILVTLGSQHILHLCVNFVGVSLGTVAHKADCGLAVIILCSCLGNCLNDCLKIVITG